MPNQIDIFHFGPSGRGGIDTVLRQYRTLNIKNVKFGFTSTTASNNLFTPVCFLQACFSALLYGLSGKTIQLHTASNGSFFRKNLLSHIVKIFGGKYIAHIHGAYFLLYYNSSSPYRKRQIQSFINRAEIVIVLSEAWKEIISTWTTNSNVIVIPNPCHQSHLKSCHNNNAGKVRFLFSGRIGQRKGVYDLISAFEDAIARNANFTLDIYGDGEITKLKSIIANKGLASAVRVFSWVDHETYLKLIPEYDVFILPSYSESFGMSVVEAMIAGLPVITSPVGAIPEFVEDGINGRLIPPGQIELLCDAITEMGSTPDNIPIMGLRAQKRAQSYCSIEHVELLLKQCYDSIPR